MHRLSPLTEKLRDRRFETAIASLGDARWILAQRVYVPEPIRRRWREAGNALIYDLDDAVFLSGNERVRARAEEMLAAADGIIAGNEWLAEEAQNRNPHAVVMHLPTGIDTKTYCPDAQPRGDELIRIGWLGSDSTATYLKLVREPIRRILEDHSQVQLELMGARPYLIPEEWHRTGRVRMHHWRLEDEPGFLQSLDIGIMPLPDTEWARGKCGYKLIQYMATGVAAVGSPIGANPRVMPAPECGRFATGEAEWESALRLLVEDPGLRNELGRAGRNHVCAHFDQAVLFTRLREWLEEAFAPHR